MRVWREEMHGGAYYYGMRQIPNNPKLSNK
jgi:hypothetical protein